MSGSIEINASQLDSLIAKIRSASRPDLRGVLDAIGEQQEDAARRRINDTKKAPDGTDWKEWSPAYAKTRGPKHSKLVNKGELRRRLTHLVHSDEVEIGSPMVYAAVHLYGHDFGGRKVPARPYLDTTGDFVDPRDRDEIRDIVETFIREELLA